ncbi:MAG: glycosyltransferase [Actinomycetota bacterium]|nr:glycosyltransferase [Actinomycetota bacterium]
MARYLVYTSPARGHLYPIVPTLLELGRRGHEVHIRTLSSELATLRELGIHASPVASAIEELPLQDWRGATPEEGLAAGLRTFADRATYEIPDLEGALEEVDPDFVLVDVMTLGAAAVAEVAGLPWAQWIPFFQHIFPFTLTASGIDVINVPREQVGLPTLGSRDLWRAPLYVYLTAPPFLPPTPLPPSVLPVGPGSWEPPRPTPQWIEHMTAPLVLVAVSSEFQRDDALVETALEAFSSEDIELVITTAAHGPERFQRRERAKIARWLPHAAVLSKAACVVCHGGMGITQKALGAGVPVCVVPFGRDQFEVAQRVEHIGAGTWLPPGELHPISLRSAVRETMSRRAAAQQVAAQFGAAGGAEVAANTLESLRVRHHSGLSQRERGRQVLTVPFGSRVSQKASLH